jgi:hypothetical protein
VAELSQERVRHFTAARRSGAGRASERSLGRIARGQDALQDVHDPALLLYITGFSGNEHRRDLQCFKSRLLTPYQTIPSGKDLLGVKLSQLLLEAVGQRLHLAAKRSSAQRPNLWRRIYYLCLVFRQANSNHVCLGLSNFHLLFVASPYTFPLLP